MQRFNIVHEFAGDPDHFWEIFFREDYNRAVYGAVQVELVEVLKDERTSDAIRWSVRFRSTKEPSALMKPFLPDGLGYVEHGVFDRASGRYEHTIEPNTMADRTEIRGTVTVEPVAPGRFRRTYAGTVSIRVPVLGGRLESGAIEQMQRSNDTAATVTAEWLARRAEA